MRFWKEAPLPQESVSSMSAFTQRFGEIYEHSAWVARAVWEAGLPQTLGQLADAMRHAVEASDQRERVELLRAHPELAGKTAIEGGLTKSSEREQRGVGLNQCSAGELALINRLNEAYRMRFGFPFIIAVSGMTRSQIIRAMEQRLKNAQQDEFSLAMKEVHKIAAIRLQTMAQMKKGQPHG